MIGVLVSTAELAVVSEFFELFKTPWEEYRPGHRYDVLLCAGEMPPPLAVARLVVAFGSKRLTGEAWTAADPRPAVQGGHILRWADVEYPVYGPCCVFRGAENALLTHGESELCAGYRERNDGVSFVRIGYDLFTEVRFLLEVGQPVTRASVPSLDLHIALLRSVILESDLLLVEIPPAPAGKSFVACLTHDVDHPRIGRHLLDHTALGFLFRASVGSLLSFMKGRMSWRQLLTNWSAVVRLPLVYLRLADDFWRTLHQYLALEEGRPSSFFIIPFGAYAGVLDGGSAPGARAAGYGVADIAEDVRAARLRGCEIGLHGIDAWRDSESAARELEAIRAVTGDGKFGVRMHWLYFDQHSPSALEEAGADYDSSVGYNDAVGYRSGTGQPWKPLSVRRLLELPLLIMDTALFLPKRMRLTYADAWIRITAILDHASREGGCVTINWHDRSIAPERLWGDCYVRLIESVDRRGAWFASASEASLWFRKRREARFGAIARQPEKIRVELAIPEEAAGPPLNLRIHLGRDRRIEMPVWSGGLQEADCAERLGAEQVKGGSA